MPYPNHFVNIVIGFFSAVSVSSRGPLTSVSARLLVIRLSLFAGTRAGSSERLRKMSWQQYTQRRLVQLPVFAICLLVNCFNA